jgi:hypothetical protein
MQALEKEYSVRQEEAEHAMRSAIRMAKQLFSDNRPQAAREELKRVLDGSSGVSRWAAPGSPAHMEARELLHEIEHALGIREGSVKTTVDKIEEQMAIKVQEARIEAQNLLTRGKAQYAAKEFPKSIETFERVLEIVRWAPSDVDLTGFADQARAYVASSEQLREQEARHRLKEKGRKARQRAMEDEVQRQDEERHGPRPQDPRDRAGPHPRQAAVVGRQRDRAHGA